jgi:hypothetical protein
MGGASATAIATRTEAANVDFPMRDFTTLNEADIREEIIAPLLKYLGYRSGTDNNVIREQTLHYPHAFLGRKKPNDPPVRGRADYICEAQKKIRWVIEAKPPNADISADDNEQAYTYANHPEIRAVYFCLTNGKSFQVFQTNRGPGQPPVYECSYEDLPLALVPLQNLLSPSAVLRTFPTTEIDTGLPIGEGLRSIVRMTNGVIVYETNSIGNKPLEGMTFTISRGAIQRNDAGRLEAYLETIAPLQALQSLNEKLGLNKFTLFSEDAAVSSDPSKPTIFIGTTEHVLPQGEKCLDLARWQEVEFQCNIRVRTTATAVGTLSGNVFAGRFEGRMLYQVPGLLVPGMPLEIVLNGNFKVYLS